MRQTTLKRLERLEQESPANSGKWHTIFADSETALVDKQADLMASSAWSHGDNLIGVLFVGTDLNFTNTLRVTHT